VLHELHWLGNCKGQGVLRLVAVVETVREGRQARACGFVDNARKGVIHNSTGAASRKQDQVYFSFFKKDRSRGIGADDEAA
jgi:hypothetical protein